MAKIIAVELLHIPEIIHVGDDVNDIVVRTKIEFHELDIQLKMEYCLDIFVYDIHGEMDTLVVIPNWDESKIEPVSLDRKDEFLGVAAELVRAFKKEVIIELPIALKLGNINKDITYISRKLEVFATMAPAIGRSSKWSEPFKAQISY